MPAFENAYALIVGIARYQSINSLPTAVLNDVRSIYAALVDPQVCAYPPGNVTLLTDAAATKAALYDAFARLVANTNENSTVFIYFSGHGAHLDGGDGGHEYLLPVDARLATSASLVQTAISGSEVTAFLNGIPARRVVVIFDCCHAGGIGQPKDAQAPVLKGGLSEVYYEQLHKGRGRVILASSRSSELSWILPNHPNSLFTKHLVAGLRGGIMSDNGFIHIFELFEYLQPRVTGDHAQQHPVFKAEIEENFPIALYLGQKKGVTSEDKAGFRYDAYISYVDQGQDSFWVWNTLVPKLEAAGLRVSISGDVETPGVARVINIERGITQSKRTVIVLSNVYLDNQVAEFENILAQTMGIQEGSYRLLPVFIEEIEVNRLPTRISMLSILDLAHPHRGEREFQRLIKAIQGLLPTRTI